MKTYIGIDNGVSGSIGVINSDNTFESVFIKTPCKHEQSYTKTKKNIGRIIFNDLYDFLKLYNVFNPVVVLERAMVNPARFDATISALRALEATIICLEQLNMPLMYVDSKQWQREILPSGLKGSDQLKKASMDIGCRLFPQHKDLILKHKDADGILIAEWARRSNL